LSAGANGPRPTSVCAAHSKQSSIHARRPVPVVALSSAPGPAVGPMMPGADESPAACLAQLRQLGPNPAGIGPYPPGSAASRVCRDQHESRFPSGIAR
jgi:hypothetical protein